MAIRIKNLDFGTNAMKRTHQVPAIAATSSGVFNSIAFIAPVDCKVDYVDFYGGAFSANTSATLKITLYKTGASGSTTAIIGLLSIATSAATNNYSANARVRVYPSASSELSAGALMSVEISSVSAAIISSTIGLVTYTPLVHRGER